MVQNSKFVMKEKQIVTSFSDLKKEPCLKSPLETQCLFGEKVIILKKTLKWSYVKCKIDNYKGWLKNETLSEPFNHNYVLNSLNAIIFDAPDLKSKSTFNLFMGAKVFLNHFNDDWYRINLNKNKKGFILAHFLKPDEKNIHWTDTIKFLKIHHTLEKAVRGLNYD